MPAHPRDNDWEIMAETRKLKLSTLRKAHACHSNTDRFKLYFGKSVNVTPALAERFSEDFDFEWATNTFLSEEAQKKVREVTSELHEDIISQLEQTRKDRLRERLTGGTNTPEDWHQYRLKSDRLWKRYRQLYARTFAENYINDPNPCEIFETYDPW